MRRGSVYNGRVRVVIVPKAVLRAHNATWWPAQGDGLDKRQMYVGSAQTGRGV